MKEWVQVVIVVCVTQSHTQRLLCEIFHFLVLRTDFGCSVYHRLQYEAVSTTMFSAPPLPALCRTAITAVLLCRVCCQLCFEPAVSVDLNTIGSA